MRTDARSSRPAPGILDAGLLLSIGLIACSPPVPLAEPRTAEPVTILLVRHAEKAGDGSADPELTEAGRRRALALAGLVRPLEITHLYSTEYRRTRQTLGPVAEQTGREIIVIPARDLDTQVKELRGLPGGSVAVVSGHSNTVGHMACELAGETGGLDCSTSGRNLDEDVHDRVFIVVLFPTGEADTLAAGAMVLSYGD